MARQSYTSSTLGEPIPHTGVESDLHRHPNIMKLKNKFSLNPPRIGLGVTCPFLQFWTREHQRITWTNLTHSDTQPIARNPPILGQT